MRRLPSIVLPMFTCVAGLVAASCSSGIRTAAYENQRTTPLILARDDASCEAVGEEHIVRVLYVVPVNSLEEDELRPSDKPARRYTVAMRGTDILYSTLGFLFGVVTETNIAWACDAPEVLVDAAELQRLRERAAERTAMHGAASSSAAGRTTGATPHLIYPNDASSVHAPRSYSIYFPFQSFALTPTQRTRLKAVAAQLQGRRLVLIGHADANGEESTNLRLSWERAASVRRELIGLGFDGADVITAAASENWPADSETKAWTRRRVELVLLEDRASTDGSLDQE